MPYLVTCPKCATKLKSAQPVPAGRNVTCPQCKLAFTLREAAPELDLPTPAASAAPPRAAAPTTRRSERPASRQRDEHDEDDRPRSRRRDEDEEDDRPRSKRRPVDEEEDHPKSRKRRDDDDDEEEDRPKARKRRVEDDEDEDRPKSRKRRDEDDEDEDRPKSRKGRSAVDEDDEDDGPPRYRGGKKKKGRKGLVLILAGVAALLLLCGGGGAVMYFADPFGVFGGSGASSDMLAWLPADTQSIEGVDFVEVGKNPKALAASRQYIKDAESMGIKAEDVSTAIQGKKSGRAAADVTILKLRSSADKDKIVKAAGGQEATVSGKKYYKTKGGGALFFASEKIVVVSSADSTMIVLLSNADGKVLISKELQDCVKRADGHLWAVAVGSEANMVFGGAGGAGAKGGMPGFPAPPPPKSSVMTAKLSGDDANIKIELTFADADTAKKAAEQVEAGFKVVRGMIEGLGGAFGKMDNAAMKKMQDAKKMFDSLKVTTSGSVVTITMTGPIDSIEGFGKGGGLGGM